MIKVTDKAFIVRIRRALKEGASIDALKNEVALYRESRIREACEKAQEPLTEEEDKEINWKEKQDFPF